MRREETLRRQPLLPVELRDVEALRGRSRGAAARGAALGGQPHLLKSFRAFFVSVSFGRRVPAVDCRVLPLVVWLSLLLLLLSTE